MEIDLHALHFIRPWWLLICLPALLLPWLWRRQHDEQRRLRGVIAPHLLKHLLIRPQEGRKVRPVYLLSAFLLLGALAAAGPSWQQDKPPFVEDRAPLLLAVDLSPSMDASDIVPSRLQAVKNKLHDLVERRAGARTGLLAYAGSAHLVLPPTDDPELLTSFIQALDTDLIDTSGKNTLGVVEISQRLLHAESSPGSLVLITDGADTRQLDALSQQLSDSPVDLQVLVLTVGHSDGSVLTNANGAPRLDPHGKPLLGSFDPRALEQLAKATHAPLGSLTRNADDLDWIQLHAQQHFAAANDDKTEVRWKDAGYWLCWLLLPLAWLSLRRGWSVSWLPAVFIAVGLSGQSTNAEAGILADAFFTPDQQGRWYFEQERYPEAAQHFSDPYWKGLAAYRAAEFEDALASFARLDSAAAYFYIGNSQARLHHYPEAIRAYQQALRLQPAFPQAQFNLALLIELQRIFEEEQQLGSQDDQGQEKHDDKGNPDGKGQQAVVETPVAIPAELWLRNLNTSPAGFLRQKFKLQKYQQVQP